MTKNEFIEKYGDVKVKFSYYYKYTFNYIGSLPDGSKISVGYGGNADEIYKYEVVSNTEETVSNVDPYTGAVLNANGQLIDEFYDY